MANRIRSQIISVNEVINNTFAGAAIGTAFPTGLSQTGEATRSVVGFGVADGIDYIDIRCNGTAAGTGTQAIFTPNVTAGIGTTWTNSVWVALVGGTFSNVSAFTLRHGSESGGLGFTPTATLTRYTNTRTLTSTVTSVVLRYNYVSAGVAYDFTLRIGLPQTELGNVATDPIRTSGAARARSVVRR